MLKTKVNPCSAKRDVKVGALSEVTARLVNGSTLHNMFKLPVQKDSRIVNMPLLTGKYVRVMRGRRKEVKFPFNAEVFCDSSLDDMNDRFDL